MLDPDQFRHLVSGRRRGPLGHALRAGLSLCEAPYRWVVQARNRRYDAGAAAVHRVEAPVVSVGNLTLGGTGKTPMVRYLAQWFLDRGVRVGLISRGYGSQRDRPNDEALELAATLPDTPHVQNPDRVAAAREAVDRHGCRLLILDDAFQHRRLHRDLDIVLLDALEPFGFDRVFPRGTLREPLTGLARADVVALSRADLLDAPGRAEIAARAAQLAPEALWIEVAHRPTSLLRSDGEVRPVDDLAGRPVAAVCAIGNPAGFRHTLARCGFDVIAQRTFPDHHQFSDRDRRDLAQWADTCDRAEAIVCTHKDLVKLAAPQLGQRPLWALQIGIDVVAGRPALEQGLTGLL